MAKKSMLVVYYTWSNGNTEKIAEQLADACGADLTGIKTVKRLLEQGLADGNYNVRAKQPRTLRSVHV